MLNFNLIPALILTYLYTYVWLLTCRRLVPLVILQVHPCKLGQNGSWWLGLFLFSAKSLLVSILDGFCCTSLEAEYEATIASALSFCM